MKGKSEFDYRDSGCPWCGGKVKPQMEWGASIAFSSDEDFYPTCTECSWNGHKADSFDISW